MRPLISTIIEDYFTQNLPVFTEEMHEDDFYAEDDTETVQIIKEILEGRVRPYVQEDGGDIKFKGFSKDTGIVKLEMRGSCAGCPSSGATLKEGIEKMMMFYLPEVKGVEAVDS